MAYDFHKSIPDVAAVNIYANKHEKYIKRFNNEFVKKFIRTSHGQRSSPRVEKKRI